MFEDFWGNAHVTEALEQMAGLDRLPQTMLFAGPEGVGKATLARRLGAALLGHGERIEQDDLSLPENVKLVAEREKMPPDRRNEDPLLFASHPDFVTFAPDGPLAPAHDSAEPAAEGARRLHADARQQAHFPDRPYRPRQRAGGEFAAEDTGGAARRTCCSS